MEPTIPERAARDQTPPRQPVGIYPILACGRFGMMGGSVRFRVEPERLMYQPNASADKSAPLHRTNDDACNSSGTSVIVYLEDNEDDYFLLKHALSAARLPCRLEVFATADTARDFLRDCAPKAPDLVICDLGLAGACGLDIIEWLRGQPHLEKVPVLLVTGALPPGERARAAKLNVEACFEKSVDWRALTRQIQQILSPESYPVRSV